LNKPDLTPYLGQRVRVVVDRPLGSVHPRHPDLIYPVNYGEIPGTLSGDGHPIDADLFGWEEPTEGGRRRSDCRRAGRGRRRRQAKLVVAREGTCWTDEAIWQAAEFQERLFRTRLLRSDTLPT
jgi:Inorganic pyrophosphatase